MEHFARGKVKMKAETKTRKAEQSPWGSGAADVLLLVFVRLPAASLARASAVCTAWHNVVTNCPFVWEKALEEQRKELKLKLSQSDVKLVSELDFRTRAATMYQRAHLVHGKMYCRWWKAHPSRADCCHMSMNTIVSGSTDQTVRVWCASSLHCLEEYKVSKPKSPVVDLEFDANKIIAAAGAEVWVWNRNRGGRVTHQMGGHGCRLYCLSCTESDVSVGCADGAARIFDLYSGRCSRILRCHSAAVSSLCVQEEMSVLATGSRDGSVQICDTSTGEIVARLLRPSPMREVECLQWGRNGHFLFAGTSVGRLCCWDIRKQAILWQKEHDRSVMKSLHLQEYGLETLVTGSMNGIVRVWDSSSGNCLVSIRPCDNSDTGSVSRWSETAVPQGGISNSSSVMSPLKQVPILCVRVGSTRILTSHTDGSLALCQIQLQELR
uniref:F-box domain-containing protein n=4 Tax=Physcomitrium patens TaxID=3218 RepID=A0A2K1K825_PHYPA|nr:hypothetical protein PHYPA_011825 [Physcomitrium patens]